MVGVDNLSINGLPVRSPVTAEHLMQRLLKSMPAATFEMETLTRLAGVQITNRIPTAAVECVHRPNLLLNADFVSRHCERDEHLFLLVMHELWHVILSHTALYPRVTLAQNIAFDAIINSGLARQFMGAEYRGFFDKLNPPDKFPHLLLRPPVGWPEAPVYPPDVGPPGTTRILRQLYPPQGRRFIRMPFYQEILNLIREDLRSRGMLMDGVPVLLGDHDPDREESGYTSELLKDAAEELKSKMPPIPGLTQPAGFGGRMSDWKIDKASSSREARQAFAWVLRKTLGNNSAYLRRRTRTPIEMMSGNGVLPNPYDRLQSARRAMGIQQTLWDQKTTRRVRVPEQIVRSFVYIDVSGSMGRVLPSLLHLLLPYVVQGYAEAFQFSTRVTPLSARNLRQNLVQTTGGTMISCVTQHLLEEQSKVRRVLILTDGRTGKAPNEHIDKLLQRSVSIHVVLPAESAYRRDLEALAHTITVLPRLQ